MMKILLVILFFLISCASPLKLEKKSKVKKSQIKNYFSLKKEFMRKKNKTKIINRLNQIRKSYPNTDLEEKINQLIGFYYYENGVYKKSYSYLSKNLKFFPHPENFKSIIFALKSLFHLGEYKKLKQISRDLSQLKVPAHYKMQFLDYLYKAHIKSQEYLKALMVIQKLFKSSKKKSQKSKYKIKAIQLVEINLTESDLKIVIERRSLSFLHDSAGYQLGLIYYERGDLDQALDYFQFVVDKTDNENIASLSKDFIESVTSQRNINSKTIAVILPLSGKYQYMGEKVLKGFQLGLGIFDSKKDTDYQLIIQDNLGDEFLTQSIFKKIVKEYKPIAVVGGVLGKNATELAKLAKYYKIPVFLFSQKHSIAQSPYVLRSSLQSASQVKWLVKTSLEKGKKNFAILFPNDPYGVEYANLFWDEVLKQGGNIKGAQAYDLKKYRLSYSLEKLLGTYYLEDRLEEYEELLKTWFMKRKYFSLRTRPPKNLLPLIQDFDVIFIPDTPRNAYQVISQIQYYKPKDLLILGTNSWNSWNKLNKKLKEQEMAYIDTLSDSLNPRSQFYQKYYKTFSDKPHVFSAHAHDIAFAIKESVKKNPKTRDHLLKILNKKTFQGVLGKVHIQPSGEFLRSLFLFESKGDLFTQTKDILKIQGE